MILQDKEKFKHFCYFSIDMKTGLTLAYLRTICESLETCGNFFVFLKGGVWIFWWWRVGLLWKGGVERVSRFRVGLVAKGGLLFSRVGYQPRRKKCLLIINSPELTEGRLKALWKGVFESFLVFFRFFRFFSLGFYNVNINQVF